jgi:hypothetical protein
VGCLSDSNWRRASRSSFGSCATTNAAASIVATSMAMGLLTILSAEYIRGSRLLAIRLETHVDGSKVAAGARQETMTEANQVQAPPVGRVIRLVIGVALVIIMIPTYLRVGVPFLFKAALLIVALLVVYGLIHAWVSHRWLGSILASALLVLVYLLGSYHGLLLGRGEGQVAAVTFLAVSLLVASLRGDAGCELTSIPSALFGQRSRLACLVFSPIDWLERKLR